jgi:hypoxanthine-guanine phosphoribosyltransferase
MKPPVTKLLPALQQESQAAREKRAAVELNVDVVRIAMFNAAKAGQTALRVKMPSDLDVRGTEAAVSFGAWIIENGFTLSWEKRAVDLEDGRRVEVFEPEISWQIL